jgi:hypothetical protein
MQLFCKVARRVLRAPVVGSIFHHGDTEALRKTRNQKLKTKNYFPLPVI